LTGSGKPVPSRRVALLLLFSAVALAAGCSGANTSGGTGADGGTSPGHLLPSGDSVPGWTIPAGGSQHAISSTQEYASGGTLVSCTECHGSDLRGGISRTSCFGNPAGCHHGPVSNWYDNTAGATSQPHGRSAKNAPGSSGFASCQICHGKDFSVPLPPGEDNCGQCHGSSAPHPVAPWRGSPYTHADTNTANAPVCVQCHYLGSPNNPHPPQSPAPAGTAPGCFNGTMCHDQALGHPVPYNLPSHYAVDNAIFLSNCSICHDLSPPSVKSGPVCGTCHAAGSPLTLPGCTSCHAGPPSGAAGSVYPNIAGAHSVHLALNRAGTPVSCDTCHDGLGPSLQNLDHYNRAKSRVAPGDVLFLAMYGAQSGASSFENSAALGCTNVSCHGGQATPNWRDGRIDAGGHCAFCHSFGTDQYNSYNSGPGIASVVGPHHTAAADCIHCHNTTALAVNHFTRLATPAMEGPASATIGGGTTSIPAGNYIPATRMCTPSCHEISGW